jgi:hypothetical protein
MRNQLSANFNTLNGEARNGSIHIKNPRVSSRFNKPLSPGSGPGNYSPFRNAPKRAVDVVVDEIPSDLRTSTPRSTNHMDAKTGRITYPAYQTHDWRQHREFLHRARKPLLSFHVSAAGRKAGKDQPVFLFLRVIFGVELRCLRACQAGNGWHWEIEGLLFHQQRL